MDTSRHPHGKQIHSLLKQLLAIELASKNVNGRRTISRNNLQRIKFDLTVLNKKYGINFIDIVNNDKVKINAEPLIFLVMEQRSDVFKDNFDSGLQIIEQFLGSAERHSEHITKLLNLPLFFYRKQTLTAPYFTFSLPHSRYQDRIEYKSNTNKAVQFKKERKRYLSRPSACLSTTKSRSKEEPLLFECSAESLNLLTWDCNRPNQAMRKVVPKSQGSLSDKLTVFTLTKDEGDNSSVAKTDSLTFLSTSSSNSSTREFYLPAASGSNDTFKVADVLSLAKTKQQSRISAGSIDDESNRSTYSDVQNQLGKINILPPQISHYEFSNSTFPKPEFNHNSSLGIINNNSGEDLLIPKHQEIRNNSHNNNQLSLIVRRSNLPIPLITIDKLCDEVLMKLKINEMQQESDDFLNNTPKLSEDCKKQINAKYIMKREQIPSEKNLTRALAHSDVPSPLDWVKEMKDHKYILNQDIIENESLGSSKESNRSYSRLNNKRIFPNSYDRTSPKESEEVFITCEDNLERNEDHRRSINNTSELLSIGTNNISIKKEKYKQNTEINNDKIFFGDIANTGVKLVTNGSMISYPNMSEEKDSQFEENVDCKYKKLSGFFELSSQKPTITKLLIPSDLVIEGSGSGLEDKAATIQVKRRKQRPFQKSINNERLPFEEYGEKEANLHRLNNYNEKVKSQENNKNCISEKNKKINIRSSQDACVYSETILTDENNFQKLREKFEFKNKISERDTTYFSNVIKNAGKHTNCSIIENKLDSRKNEIEVSTENEAAVKENTQPRDNNLCSRETTKKENNEQSKIKNELSINVDIEKIVEKKKSLEEIGKPKHRRLMTKNGHPAHLYDETGFPLTDMKGRILKNNLGLLVLNAKNYQEVITKNLTVYDSDNTSVNDSGFDPSKIPEITTIAKITDQVGNPMSLYNNIGYPLTDEDGLLLHDSKGEILVSLDSKFFPLCCKNGTPIYLRNGSTWLSQRYKYIVTTQNRVKDFEKKVQKKTKTLNNFSNDVEINLAAESTSSSVRKPFLVSESCNSNNLPPEKKAASTQYVASKEKGLAYEVECRPPYMLQRAPTRYNKKHSAAEVIIELLYNKLIQNKTKQSEKNKKETMLTQNYDNFNKPKRPLINKKEKQMTHKHCFPLYNRYGDSLLSFDDYDWAISDSVEPVFNTNGEQVFQRIQNCNHKIKNTPNSYSAADKWLEPERPYCELRPSVSKGRSQHFYSPSLYSDQSEDTLRNYSQAEPLVKIVNRKDIRAWDINNEVPSSVKSVYSLPTKTFRQYRSPGTNDSQEIPHNDHTKNRNGRSVFSVNYHPVINPQDYITRNLPEEEHSETFVSAEDINHLYGSEIQDEYDEIYDEIYNDMLIDDYYPSNLDFLNVQHSQAGLSPIQRHSENQYYQRKYSY